MFLAVALTWWLLTTSAATSQTLQLSLFQDSIGNCEVISLREVPKHRELRNSRLVEDKRRASSTSVGKTQRYSHILHYYAHEEDFWIIQSRAETICSNGHQLVLGHRDTTTGSPQAVFYSLLASTGPLEYLRPPELVVKPLFVSGPSDNRVDLVFFSDGYTESEAGKFFGDAHRLASDMSANQTFSSVSPLLNFWAAFTPSAESGIGVDGKPRNTTFGLYRDGTELRGVYPGNINVARTAALSLGAQCDYPILLGNDPLYGGLGGEFSITTASEINGALVLRHELGHSVIDVGEEYDGGFAYFGVNSETKHHTQEELKWDHWLPLDWKPRIERSVMPFQAYPWLVLNDTTPAFRAHFTSAGDYTRFLIMFSISGAPLDTDLSIKLDDKELEFVPRQDIGFDRWHYEVRSDAGVSLAAGDHEIIFHMGGTAKSGQVQVCSVEILEFGNDEEFNSTTGATSLYPTYSFENKTTYRPTNSDCLMRRVTETNFCSPCLEGLWHALFKRVDLIDEIHVGCGDKDDPKKAIKLALLPLAQLREAGKEGLEESYVLEWRKDDEVIDQSANVTWTPITGSGTYEVRVQFFTSQVRRDPKDLLFARRQFLILDGSDAQCPQMIKTRDLPPVTSI